MAAEMDEIAVCPYLISLRGVVNINILLSSSKKQSAHASIFKNCWVYSIIWTL